MADQFLSYLRIILNHLVNWGEISYGERNVLKSSTITFLEQSNIIQKFGDVWVTTSYFKKILPVENIDEILGKICFITPSYFRYLLVLSAGEIARNSLEGAMELTENWVRKDFGNFVMDINNVLDEVESGYLKIPIKQATPGNVVNACKIQMENIQQKVNIDFDSWNRELFSISGNNEAVFQALLYKKIFQQKRPVINDEEIISPSKIVDLNTDLSKPSGRLVFFPPIDNQEFDMGDLNIQPRPTWRKRQYVYSSIPLFGIREDTVITPESIQFAFCQHPIPWILIQLGIVQNTQRILGKGESSLHMQVQREEDDQIGDLLIFVGDHPVQKFSSILPDLLHSLGFILVLPFGKVPKSRVGTLVAILIKAGIFNLEKDGSLTLFKEFVSRLYEIKWLREMVKVPKPFRSQLIRGLRKT